MSVLDRLGRAGAVLLEPPLRTERNPAVRSVNGMTGAVILNAASVGALPASARGVSNGVAPLNSTGQVTNAAGEVISPGGGGSGLSKTEVETLVASLAAERANNLSDLASAGTARANLHIPMLTPVTVVATANIVLAGIQTIDTVLLEVGSTVLCVGQTAAENNGVWTVAEGAWTRPAEFATGLVVKARRVTVILGSGSNEASDWLLRTTGSILIGTNTQTWVRTSSSGGGGGGASTTSVGTIFWNSFEYEGVKYEYTQTNSAAKVDAAPIIQKALEKAKNMPGGRWTVTCSEPIVGWLGSLRLSTSSRPYPKLEKPYLTLSAALHVPGGVTLEAPGGNASAMILEATPALREACEAGRASSAYSCVLIGVEAGSNQEHANLGALTLGCSGTLGRWLFSKEPPPLPDAIYAASTGVYERVITQGAIRHSLVVGANHFQVRDCTFGGWSKRALLNWASEGAVTGNNEFFSNNCIGGFCDWFVDSNCSISGTYIDGDWSGFGTHGPIIYKPVTGSKKHIIGGLKTKDWQIEGGRGPLIYSEDELSGVENLTVYDNQIASSDAPMSYPTPSDIYLGYDPTGKAGPNKEPFGGHGVLAFIHVAFMANVEVIGTGLAAAALLAASGYGPGGATIIARESMVNCHLGDFTKAVANAGYHGLPVIRTEALEDVDGTFRSGNSTMTLSFSLAATNIHATQALRSAVSPLRSAKFAVRAFQLPAGGAAGSAAYAGAALLDTSAGNWAPVLRRDPARPSIQTLAVANLGSAAGPAGSIPPPSRGQQTALSSIFAAGTGRAAPIVDLGFSAWHGAIYASSLGDFSPTGGLLSTHSGVLVSYRQGIAEGAKKTFAASTVAGSRIVTLGGGVTITGIAPRMKVTGTRMPLGAQIEVVDAVNLTLYLNAPALTTGTTSLTVEAPCAIFEGTLVLGCGRLTAAADMTTMTKGGAGGVIHMDSTANMPASGGFEMRTEVFAGARVQCEYSSKTATELKGVKLTNPASSAALIPSGSIVVPTGSNKKIGPKAGLLRAAAVASIGGETGTYNGALIESKTLPETLTVTGAGALPAKGEAVIGFSTTLAGNQTLVQGVNQVIKVATTVGAPPEGKLEILPASGPAAKLEYTRIVSATEFEGTMKPGKEKVAHLAGETVVLANTITIAYGKRTSSQLEEVQALTPVSVFVEKGATITAVLFSPEGGVLSPVGSEQRFTYGTAVTLFGQSYVAGISMVATSEGTELASGSKIENVTVLAVQGGRFAPGPSAGVVVGSGASETVFKYLEVIGGTRETGEAEVEEEPEGEGEGEGEPEPEPESSAGEGEGLAAPTIYLVGVTVGAGESLGGAAGTYMGGDLLTEAVNLAAAPTAIKTGLNGANFPSVGTLKFGKNSVLYKSIAAVNKAITGTLTKGKTTAVVSSTVGLTAGAAFSGAFIPAGTTIAAIINATELTMSAEAEKTVSSPEAIAVAVGYEFKELTVTLGGSVHAYEVGAPVTLWPGKQVPADTAVRPAFGVGGRTGLGDIGVATAGGEGNTIGTSIAADLGCFVEVVVG